MQALTIQKRMFKVEHTEGAYQEVREVDGELSHSVQANTYNCPSCSHLVQSCIVFVRDESIFQAICQLKKSVRYLFQNSKSQISDTNVHNDENTLSKLY